MADNEDFNEDDLFADIYENEDAPPPPEAPAPAAQPTVSAPAPQPEPTMTQNNPGPANADVTNISNIAAAGYDDENTMNGPGGDGQSNDYNNQHDNGGYPPIGIKEDGGQVVGRPWQKKMLLVASQHCHDHEKDRFGNTLGIAFSEVRWSESMNNLACSGWLSSGISSRLLAALGLVTGFGFGGHAGVSGPRTVLYARSARGTG